MLSRVLSASTRGLMAFNTSTALAFTARASVSRLADVQVVSTVSQFRRVPLARALSTTAVLRQPRTNDEANSESSRLERLRLLRHKLRSEWSIMDPFHLQLMLSYPLSRVIRDPDAVTLVSGAATATTYAVGLLSAAGTLGIDTSPILALSTTLGVTLGFALRDIASNFLAGLMLVSSRPFQRGDAIALHLPSSLGKLEGTVERLDMRLLYLRGEDGRKLLVPTSLVFGNPITVIRSAQGDNTTSSGSSSSSGKL